MAKRRRQTTDLMQKTANVFFQPAVAAVLVFFSVCLCSETTAPDMAQVLLMTALAAIIFGFRKLRERFCMPVAALTALVLWSFFASLYAQSGVLARLEIVKISAAFSLSILLLVLARGRGETPGLWVASVLAGVSALISLVSIDLLSTRLVSGLFQTIMGLFSDNYSALEGVEEGIRMLSVVENPNVYAGIAGIGVLLSLGLYQGEERPSGKYFALSCLYLNALGFVLAFSMGATALIAVAFVVYLVLEHRERRGTLLVLMLGTLFLTLLGAFAVSLTSFGPWTGIRIVPLLCAAVGSALLCLSDRFGMTAAAEGLRKNGKWLFAGTAAIVAAIVGFAILACSITGSVSMEAGQTLRRAVQVTGDCCLEAEGADGVMVRVESQNRQQTVTHTSTELYCGSVSDAAFTVDGDSLVVWLEFTAQEDTLLREVTVGGKNVPLNYPLLPDFISNRLQGLWANQNAIQRLAFFSDGWKIFTKSPVIGLGLGSFENHLFGVQSFYYESRHVHNHYIQLLADTGIVGLCLFLALLVLCARTVILGLRRKDGHVLLPALGAALVFMAGHAAVEVVFSYYAYLPFAFGVFVIIGLCGGQDVLRRNKTAGTLSVAAVMVLVLAMTVPLMSSVSSENAVRTRPTPQVILESVRKDPYCWSTYAMSYLQGAETQKSDPVYLQQADALAQRLEKKPNRIIRTKLAVYYFETGREAEGFEQLEQAVLLNRAHIGIWEEAFDALKTYRSDTRTYADGVARMGALLRQWMKESLTPVELRQEWVDLLDQVCPQWNEE